VISVTGDRPGTDREDGQPAVGKIVKSRDPAASREKTTGRTFREKATEER
jgi:hypothetical protein